jgi:hypothetical protein
MTKPKIKNLAITLATLIITLGSFSQNASARATYQSPKKYVAPAPTGIDTQWADSHGPWDFSGLLGLYNPGFGFEALAAYRVADNLINDLDESLSVETGIGYSYANDTYFGTGISYSQIEVPFMARWDFRIPNSRFIAGPRGGFNYFTAGTATVNNVQITQRGGALYLQLGGFGMYNFNDKWAARVQLMFINYTVITFGATYFL